MKTTTSPIELNRIDLLAAAVPGVDAHIAVACTALLVAGVAVTVVHVARPSSTSFDGDGDRVDAVLVYASNESRLETGIALVDSGVGDTLAVSELGTYGRSPTSMTRLCAQREPELACVAPEPTNTLGEARAFGQLAAERGWQRVAVVTNRAHLTRATMSVRQCTEAHVSAVAVDPEAEPPMPRVRDEWLRTTATATLVRAC